MFTREDIQRIVLDFFRTESARRRKDVLLVFDEPQTDDFLHTLPTEVQAQALAKIQTFFGFEKSSFATLAQVTDTAFEAAQKNRCFTFLTSGSTGIPKPCVHTEEMLAEESRGLAPLFPHVRRIVSLVPSSHLYGFTSTVVLPHTLNVPLTVLPALPVQPWNTYLQDGDLVVGFPLFWQYFLQAGNTFSKQVSVLSSTAPCKDEIIVGLKQAGITQFTEIYGSSETGVIGTRHHEGQPFILMPFWDLRFETDNEPQIKRKSQTTWLSLPDKVQFPSPRALRPVGRKDACVQVAGINVFPKRVEQVLLEHPSVAACRVRLMRPEEGSRLKAFIVLKKGTPQTELPAIRAFLSGKLTVHEMPRAFTFGKELPVAALGKACDW